LLLPVFDFDIKQLVYKTFGDEGFTNWFCNIKSNLELRSMIISFLPAPCCNTIADITEFKVYCQDVRLIKPFTT